MKSPLKTSCGLLPFIAIALAFGACSGEGSEPLGNFALISNTNLRVLAAVGGTLEGPVGPLGGAGITIPPQALAQDTLISLRLGPANVLPEIQRLGSPVEFLPLGTTTLASVTIRLPFAPSTMPAGASSADLVVYRASGTPETIEVVPASFNMATGIATCQVTRFARYWVAVPIPQSNPSYETAMYMAWGDGNSQSFEDGSTLATSVTASAPRLGSQSLFALSHSLRGDVTYYSVGPGGEILLHGVEYLDTTNPFGAPGLKIVRGGPVQWLPASMEVGQVHTLNWQEDVYLPWDAATPSELATHSMTIILISQGALNDTGLGDFYDTLRLRVAHTVSYNAIQGSSELIDLWYARNVGLIANGDHDGPFTTILSGIHDGAVIESDYAFGW